MMSPDSKPGSSLQILCDEPFRIFFPLGLGFALVGVSHWLWYYTGLTETYSCRYHGLLQIQGFEMSFAVGFLLTALPRFLEVPGAHPVELLIALALLLATGAGLYIEDPVTAQVGFLALLAHIVFFVLRRLPQRRDAPPPEFLLIGFGLLHAAAGAVLILFPVTGWVLLGERMVQQGMLLAMLMGIGAHLWPRLSGTQGPPGTARLRTYRAGAAGLLLLLSFWLEAAISIEYGRSLRAVVVMTNLSTSLSLFHPPVKRLRHLRFMQAAFWLVILGLWGQVVFPDYDVVSLHLVFIGGFATLTFFIASRVVCAHCGFEDVWNRNHPAFTITGILFALGLAARLVSDFYLSYYFGMLHIGAAFWLFGAIAWAIVFVPKMSPRHVDT